jgi:hypothetical protein
MGRRRSCGVIVCWHQAPWTMGGQPATLPAGKAPTCLRLPVAFATQTDAPHRQASTQSDLSACVHAQTGWAAKTRGTPYRLLHAPVPCACPPLVGRTSGFMSTRNIPRRSPPDFRNLRASQGTGMASLHRSCTPECRTPAFHPPALRTSRWATLPTIDPYRRKTNTHNIMDWLYP